LAGAAGAAAAWVEAGAGAGVLAAWVALVAGVVDLGAVLVADAWGAAFCAGAVEVGAAAGADDVAGAGSVSVDVAGAWEGVAVGGCVAVDVGVTGGCVVDGVAVGSCVATADGCTGVDPQAMRMGTPTTASERIATMMLAADLRTVGRRFRLVSHRSVLLPAPRHNSINCPVRHIVVSPPWRTWGAVRRLPRIGGRQPVLNTVGHRFAEVQFRVVETAYSLVGWAFLRLGDRR
jgi:hypothetical protein